MKCFHPQGAEHQQVLDTALTEVPPLDALTGQKVATCSLYLSTVHHQDAERCWGLLSLSGLKKVVRDSCSGWDSSSGCHFMFLALRSSSLLLMTLPSSSSLPECFADYGYVSMPTCKPCHLICHYLSTSLFPLITLVLRDPHPTTTNNQQSA